MQEVSRERYVLYRSGTECSLGLYIRAPPPSACSTNMYISVRPPTPQISQSSAKYLHKPVDRDNDYIFWQNCSPSPPPPPQHTSMLSTLPAIGK